MSLSWVKISTIVFSLWAISAQAKEITVVGTHPYDENYMGKLDCWKEAEIDAAKKAMSEEGLQKVSYLDMDICSETENFASCSLHSEILSFITGGFIANSNILERGVARQGDINVCTVKLSATVKRYKRAPDPEFNLSVKLMGSSLLRDGESFTVVGETSKNSFVQMFAWYPNTEGQKYFRIYPNEYDRENEVIGEFRVPSQNPLRSYELKAEFPKEQKEDVVSEFIVLLASKIQVSFFEDQSAQEFFKKLDEIGRDNWELKIVGYSVMRKKT